MPVASLRDIAFFAHNSVISPRHKMGNTHVHAEVTPGAGVGLLRIFFANRLDCVGIAPFAFGSRKPFGQAIPIESFGLLTPSASGTIIFRSITARHA